MPSKALYRPAAILCGLALIIPAARIAGQVSKDAPGTGLARPTATGGLDLLILRDGSQQSGRLLGCNALGCYFGSTLTAKATIEWIGFNGRTPPPPSGADATLDTVFLDGSDKVGSLLGVSASQVVTQRGTYPRADVRWIHLAPTSPKSTGEEPGAEVTPTPPPPASPTPPSLPTPGPTARPSPSLTPAPGEKGALWTGWIQGRAWGNQDHWVTEQTFSAEVRLREYLYPLRSAVRDQRGARIGSIIRLAPEGTVLKNRYKTHGDPGTCSGEGTTTFTQSSVNEPGGSFASVIYLKTVDESIAPTTGFDIPRRGGRYHVGLLPGRKFSMQCFMNGRSFEDPMSFLLPAIGRSSLPPHTYWAEDPELRSLERGDGMMAGAFTVQKPSTESGGIDQMEVSWRICREGVDCSGPKGKPPSPTPTFDPCGPTPVQQALWETCRAQRETYVEELRKRWGEYQKTMEEARGHLGDYQKTIAACAAWDASMKILEYLVGGGMGATAGHGAEEAKELQEALKIISEFTEKMINGEDPFVIPASEHDMGVENLHTFQLACEAVARALQMLGAANPEAMAKTMEECGAPVPYPTYHSAEEFVKIMKAALEKLPEINSLMSKIQVKDIECINLQAAAYKACLDYAKCKGLPPSSCDALKLQGNWAQPH